MIFSKVDNYYRLEGNQELRPLIDVLMRFREAHAVKTLSIYSTKIDGVRTSRIDFAILPTVKHCGCGKHYTQEQWARLPLVGHGDGLEYRNCTCKSTLAIELNAP